MEKTTMKPRRLKDMGYAIDGHCEITTVKELLPDYADIGLDEEDEYTYHCYMYCDGEFVQAMHEGGYDTSKHYTEFFKRIDDGEIAQEDINKYAPPFPDDVLPYTTLEGLIGVLETMRSETPFVARLLDEKIWYCEDFTPKDAAKIDRDIERQVKRGLAQGLTREEALAAL